MEIKESVKHFRGWIWVTGAGKKKNKHTWAHTNTHRTTDAPTDRQPASAGSHTAPHPSQSVTLQHTHTHTHTHYHHCHTLALNIRLNPKHRGGANKKAAKDRVCVCVEGEGGQTNRNKVGIIKGGSGERRNISPGQQATERLSIQYKQNQEMVFRYWSGLFISQHLHQPNDTAVVLGVTIKFIKQRCWLQPRRCEFGLICDVFLL